MPVVLLHQYYGQKNLMCHAHASSQHGSSGMVKQLKTMSDPQVARQRMLLFSALALPMIQMVMNS